MDYSEEQDRKEHLEKRKQDNLKQIMEDNQNKPKLIQQQNNQNETDEDTKKGDKGEDKDKEKDKDKPDAEKIIAAKKGQEMMNNVMLLQKAILGFKKSHTNNMLELATKADKADEQFLQSELQNTQELGNVLMQKQQERMQGAQTEADRAYEERVAEYIQRMLQEEQEIKQHLLENLKNLQGARQKGLVPHDLIFKLQQESQQATKKYDQFKDSVKKMNKDIDEKYKDLKKSGQLDKLKGKKEDKEKDKEEDKKEDKQDNKTMNISGLKNVDNSKLDAGDLKDKKEEKKKSFLGL